MSKFAKVQLRPRNEQAIYVSKMMKDMGITNESEGWRFLIDLGIARREEILKTQDLLRVSANTLTLLRRMAEAADPQLITQSKVDAETLIQSLEGDNS